MSRTVVHVGNGLTGDTRPKIIKALASALGSEWSYLEDGNVAWCEKAGMGFSLGTNNGIPVPPVVVTKKGDPDYRFIAVSNGFNAYGAYSSTDESYDVNLIIYKSPNGSIGWTAQSSSNTEIGRPIALMCKTAKGYMAILTGTSYLYCYNANSSEAYTYCIVGCTNSYFYGGIAGAKTYMLHSIGNPDDGSMIKDIYHLFGHPHADNEYTSVIPAILDGGSSKYVKIANGGGRGAAVFYLRYE